MQVKNNTSGHNKVTHKWYDRLSDLIGHRAISQLMANGVDSILDLNNDSVLETSTQNVIEDPLIEEDQSIFAMPDTNNTADDALTPEQTGKMPKVSIRPPRTAPYKKSLKAFSNLSLAYIRRILGISIDGIIVHVFLKHSMVC